MLLIPNTEAKLLPLFSSAQNGIDEGSVDSVRHRAARGRPASSSSRYLVASQHSDAIAASNDNSLNATKSPFRRTLFGLRYELPLVEAEYVVFLYRSRNAPIVMCGVACALAVGAVTLYAGNSKEFSYATIVISLIWLTAGVTLTILKFQESSLVTGLQPEFHNEQNSSLTDRSPSPLRDSDSFGIEFSCSAEHVTNARRVEATLIIALVANLLLCCIVFARGDCAYGGRSPRIAAEVCNDSIQIDGVITLMLILSVMPLRLRSTFAAPVLLIFLVVHLAVTFAPRTIPMVKYYVSETIVISLQIILSIAGASILDYRSRQAFETLIRHQDKCSELHEVRARNEALAHSKFPIEAIRCGAFERSDGIWEMAGSTRVYFACITLRNFLLFSCQLPPLQILDIVRAFNNGVDQAVAQRRTVFGQQQQQRPRAKIIDSGQSLVQTSQSTHRQSTVDTPTAYDIVKFHSSGDVYVFSATPISNQRGNDVAGGMKGTPCSDVDFIRFIAECTGTAMRLLRPLIEECCAMTSTTVRSGDQRLCVVCGVSNGRGGGVMLQSSNCILPIPISAASCAIQLCREAEMAEMVALHDNDLPVVRVPADWVITSSVDNSPSFTVASTWQEHFEISVEVAQVDGVASSWSPLRRLSTATSEHLAQNPLALEPMDSISESRSFEVERASSREIELSNAVHLKRSIAWFPFLRTYSNPETETLFAEDCRQRSPLLLLCNMVLWSAALVVICGADYKLRTLTSTTNPLWWVLAALGVTCSYGLHLFLTLRDGRQSWVAATHISGFLFAICVACAVFLAPDESVLCSGQLVWMYVLFSISSSRSPTLSPLAMWSLDSCTALAFLINVTYDFSLQGKFFTYVTIAHFFYPLLFWLVLDDSSRQLFAVHHRAVLLKGLLHDDHLRLKRAIDAMAINGVAADLLIKFRSSEQITHLLSQRDRIGRHALRASNLRTSAKDCAVVALRLPAQSQNRIETCLWMQQVDLCLAALNTLKGSTNCKRTVLMFGDTASVFSTALTDEEGIPSCVSLLADTASAMSSLNAFSSNMAAVIDFGPAVGGIIGSAGLLFEYCGSSMSRARLLLGSLPQTADAPQIIVTDSFYVMVSQSTADGNSAAPFGSRLLWKFRSLPVVGVRYLKRSAEGSKAARNV